MKNLVDEKLYREMLKFKESLFYSLGIFSYNFSVQSINRVHISYETKSREYQHQVVNVNHSYIILSLIY